MGALKQAIVFLAKVHGRVENPVYRAFLQAFSKLRKGIWGLDDLDREVILLFKHHPDLIEEFRRFRIDCQWISGVGEDDLKHDLQLWLPFCKMIQQRCSFEQYSNLLKPFYVYGKGKMERADFEKRVKNSLRKYPLGFAEEFLKLMQTLSSKSQRESEKPDEKKRKRSPEAESESNKGRKMRRCTPSYEFLPDYDPKGAAATASESEDDDPRKVLNSSLVCVQQTEYAPRPPKQRTPREKMVDEIEDNLFQLDMTLSWFSSAAENTERLLNENRGQVIVIKEHLTATNLRCIGNMYKKHPEILEELYEKPILGLPVLLKQLRQKEEELKEMKKEKVKEIQEEWRRKKT